MVILSTDRKLILGSNSPRRRELLGMLVDDFTVAAVKNVEEIYPADTPADDVPVYLSRLKADAYKADLRPDELLITADTVVIHGADILGKPHDVADARSILHLLSDDDHRVVTGVTLTDINHQSSFATTTEVHFDRLSDEEIDSYIANCRPFDKAGAYGIQEWIGAKGISSIHGCYYNVMGLPLHDLYHALRRF